MNLKERLAKLKEEMLGLREGIERGDTDAIDRATGLREEIEATQAKVDAAERAKGLLAFMGNQGGREREPQGMRADTLGQRVARDVVGKAVRGERNDIIVSATKANGIHTLPAALAPGGTGPNVTFDTNVVESTARRQLVMEDLLGSETIEGNTLTYFVVDTTADGTPAWVAENGQKPAANFAEPTPVTEALSKVAMHYKETDELLEDASWLASSIDNRALYQFKLKADSDLLNGNSSIGLKGLLQRNGIQAAAYKDGGLADAIFDAMTKVQLGSGFASDAVVINPADYQGLRLAKDGNGQYYGGGFFAGQYGSGAIMEKPPIWGLRTCVTPSIAAGTILVGAYRLGGSVISKGGITVEVTNTNEDDFVHNRVTIRVERRMGLAVRYPKAFVKLSKA